MKLDISKEWLERRAALEAGHEIGAGSPPVPCYEAWFAEVKRFAKEELKWSEKALASIEDAEGWREYYDDGLTPAEAWQEEYEAAS